MRSQFRLLAGALSLLLLFSTALAQTSRGTLTGIVTDSSGAVVPNASVNITQAETKVTRQTTTNGAGIYRFDAVDLGVYSVTAKAAGFTSEDKTGVEIQASRTVDIDFALKVGSTSNTVTVEASGAEVALQTDEQVHSDHFSGQEVSTLPIVGGDSLTLAQLAPGVALASGNSINQNGTFNFSVNGQRPRGNN